jgi:hypothetical protein
MHPCELSLGRIAERDCAVASPERAGRVRKALTHSEEPRASLGVLGRRNVVEKELVIREERGP